VVGPGPETQRWDVARRRSGFTLIDLLVSIAVVAVLIGILLPSLRMVHETSRRVVCASNLRQIGLGLHMYTTESDDFIPPSMVTNGSAAYWGLTGDPMFLRLDGRSRGFEELLWDGMGLLFADDYLADGEIFYCPAHTGEILFENYADRFGGVPGEIVANYGYRGSGPAGQERLTFIDDSSALVSDGFREIVDINHDAGMNVLRAGMSVGWFADEGNQMHDIASSAGEDPEDDDWDERWRILDNPVPQGGFWDGLFD
jgi:competence protein ComGC